MFVSFTKTLKKMSGFRLGFGVRVNKRNAPLWCFSIHGVWVLCVACNLDRDCAVIVRRRRTAPRTIGFIDVKPDPPVVADPVV